MKKLMIAVVAVALASVASAAQTWWDFSAGSNLKDGYKKDADPSHTPVAISGATVYLFDAAAVSYGGKTGQAALLAAVLAGESLSDYAFEGAATKGTEVFSPISTTTDSAGKAASVSFYTPDGQYPVGTALNFFVAALSDDGKYVFVGGNKAVTTYDAAQQTPVGPSMLSTSFRGDAADGFTSGGWYAVDVPEPTSGLLLLLGVAGLALRRRRA